LESVSDEGKSEITRLESGSVTIGRDTENSIVIDSVAVSRRHAAVTNAGSQWVFRDLGSTNGSWMNGVQANPGQIRLIRDGDTLQLSDYPVVVSSVPGTGSDQQSCSLLVFSSDVFQAEYPLFPGSQGFQAGGPDGQITVDGEDPNQIQFTIRESGGQLELEVGVVSFSVIVNGMATKGRTELRDRDEVTFGLYKIVVNDAATVVSLDQPVLEVTPPKQPTLSVDEVPRHNPSDSSIYDNSSWGAETSRRRVAPGQSFVFGTDLDAHDPTGTMSYRQEEFQSRAGLGVGGMSMSQRLSSYNQSPPEKGSEVSDMLFVVIGILILAAIAGVFFFIVTYL
jgi:hypothetical protein